VDELTLKPIGFVRTTKSLKADTRHQPDPSSGEVNEIQMEPLPNLQLALQDLDGFSHIWLIWHFHLNKDWRPRVLPPRGPAVRRGVFATRSPHRPNPIGITAVELIKVEGSVLTVGPLDLVDGTPILDIKPYLPRVDSFPQASSGWTEELDRWQTAKFAVHLSPLAQEQAEYLRQAWNIDLQPGLEQLAADPSPNRTRRIVPMPRGGFRKAIGPWRIFFEFNGETVMVYRIAEGYSPDLRDRPQVPHDEAIIAFINRFPERPEP